uniref:Colony stimulating factor 1 n=1 Tax=Anolis carolinensis TaxID=28377 RepID=G1KLR4_ANOCA|nr:PREDICTED: macrophage colony-stimulating factor 1 isoform X1 [Anolis carolinensis]|eukprot:XP_008107645.1 PREDICTED: macrophage colony-stimulating factor 1 isoform X1 [Anolis carolinensis]
MISQIHIALILLIVCNIHETEQHKESCHRLITESHLRNLSDMIDSQMETSCKQTIIYVDRSELDTTECFLKAAYSPLLSLLHKIKFKDNSANFNKLERIKDLHLQLGICIDDYPDHQTCTKKFSLTPEKMLQMVHDYFSEAKHFLFKSGFTQDCSSAFKKCSDSQEKDKMESTGVVTDQDGVRPDANPVNGGGSAFLLPAFERSSSIADQLDSKETADSTLQVFLLPDTTQTQGVAEGGTRARVLRSTWGQGAAESMDFHDGNGAVISAEEWELAAVSQGPESLIMNTASFLDPTITQHQWSSQLRNLPPSPLSQQHTEFLETKSLLSGSGATTGKALPSDLPSQHLTFSGLARSSLHKQWLWAREMSETTPGHKSDWEVAASSSTHSLTVATPANLEPVYDSGVSSGSRWVTLSPNDPTRFLDFDLEDSVSATQHPSRLAVTTESSSSPQQISAEGYSLGAEGNRGRSPGGYQSTQLRERRAEREEGLVENREAEESMPGPSVDQSFIPLNTDKHIKRPEPSDTRGMAVTYVTVASVLGILLAVGGLLFYLHKSRTLTRRQPQRNDNNVERPEEGRPLNRGEEHIELQIQEV